MKYDSVRRPLFFLVCLLLSAGCAGPDSQQRFSPVPEIRPGILAGYLSKGELPNSMAILPEPPQEDSAATELDREVSGKALELRGTPVGIWR